jgi:hypothetical protein
MENIEKKQHGGAGRGQGRRDLGLKQTHKSFRLNNTSVEGFEKIKNKNLLINELIEKHLTGFLFEIGGLAVSKRGELFAIQDITSGEYWEVSSYDFEMSLRKLF